MEHALPNGFKPHFRESSITQPWEPIFSQVHDEAVHLGLTARPPHTNSRGFVHGGLIMTLSDNAMGLSCAQAGGGRGLVTVNLSVDFVSSARLGQWIEFRPRVLKAGKTLCFVEASVLADGTLCARANATFKRAGD